MTRPRLVLSIGPDMKNLTEVSMSTSIITQQTEHSECEHTLGEYNGNTIRCREIGGVWFLSATEMCKAAGKRWAAYYANQQTQGFISQLSEDLRCQNSDIVISTKGGQGEQGTWIHEDLAYHLAMWCSPEFQLWCIRQIKALTKGKPVHREVAEYHVDQMGLLISTVNRFGEFICANAKETHSRINETAAEIRGEMREGFKDVRHEIEQIKQRKPLSKKTARKHLAICASAFAGKCPCCGTAKIVGEDGSKENNVLEYDHWVSKSQAALSETWPVCKSCNIKLKQHDFKMESRTYFEAYQKRRKQYEERGKHVRCLPGMEDARQ